MYSYTYIKMLRSHKKFVGAYIREYVRQFQTIEDRIFAAQFASKQVHHLLRLAGVSI
ncbi:MAG: hypothetical protein QW416_07990 [Candidatus Nitrosocaldaceae archaeon]